jgi:hypothetical protein
LPPPTGRRDTPQLKPLPKDPRDPPSAPTPLPPQPPPQPTPPTPRREVPVITANVVGAPQINQASPRAYWIWRTPEGVWKLRTTSGDTLQRFTGFAKILKDRLLQLHITRTELERRVDVSGPYISFDFATKAQIEGFDFILEKPDSCVYFNLSVLDPPNHRNSPKDVFIGPHAVRTPTSYFHLCPKK